MRSQIREMLKRTGSRGKYYFLLLLRCPFDALFNYIQAAFFLRAFEAVEHGSSDELMEACIWFSIACLILFFYNGNMWRIYARYVIMLEGILRKKLFHHITTLSAEQIEQKTKGEWLTRFNMDVDMTINLLGGAINIPHASVALVNLLVSSVFLFSIHRGLFVISLLFVLPHLYVTKVLIAKPATQYKKEAAAKLAETSVNLTAFFTCADTAALYDGKDFLMKKFEASSKALKAANQKLHSQSAILDGILPLFGMSGYLTLLYIGGRLIEKGKLSFGELVAAFQYRGGLLLGAMMLASCMVNIKANMAGVTQLNDTFLLGGNDGGRTVKNR